VSLAGKHDDQVDALGLVGQLRPGQAQWSALAVFGCSPAIN
jgi:hypothetical protein